MVVSLPDRQPDLLGWCAVLYSSQLRENEDIKALFDTVDKITHA